MRLSFLVFAALLACALTVDTDAPTAAPTDVGDTHAPTDAPTDAPSFNMMPTSAPTYEPVENSFKYMWIGVGFALTIMISIYLDIYTSAERLKLLLPPDVDNDTGLTIKAAVDHKINPSEDVETTD
jgi:hypothetical protein